MSETYAKKEKTKIRNSYRIGLIINQAVIRAVSAINTVSFDSLEKRLTDIITDAVVDAAFEWKDGPPVTYRRNSRSGQDGTDYI